MYLNITYKPIYINMGGGKRVLRYELSSPITLFKLLTHKLFISWIRFSRICLDYVINKILMLVMIVLLGARG